MKAPWWSEWWTLKGQTPRGCSRGQTCAGARRVTLASKYSAKKKVETFFCSLLSGRFNGKASWTTRSASRRRGVAAPRLQIVSLFCRGLCPVPTLSLAPAAWSRDLKKKVFFFKFLARFFKPIAAARDNRVRPRRNTRFFYFFLFNYLFFKFFSLFK